MKENIYINKISDKKYEVVTKDINFEPGVYSLFALEKNLFVIKKQFYKTGFKTRQEITKEAPKANTETETNEKEETKWDRENDKKETSQEWYKKALELKAELNKNQFMVLVDLEDVRKISYVTRQEINSGEIIGIRGFDKNYYIFKKELFEKTRNKILNTINVEPMSYDALLEKTKLPKEQLTGCIELLKEQSDLIEIKKGLFKKV